jgi:hypothetical protein
LTRFIPPAVAQFFETGSVVADIGEEKITLEPPPAGDIRKVDPVDVGVTEPAHRKTA